MTPETEVIACPACRHLVRVPLDWLGTRVQCPECKAMFLAPVREGGRLTEPELLSRPASAAPAPARKPDVMLLAPAFGLMLCGIVALIADAAGLYIFWTYPGGPDAWANDQLVQIRKFGIGVMADPAEQAARDQEDKAQMLFLQKWLLPLGLVISPVVLAGGLSIALRWSYRLAKIGCALAPLNFPLFCCVPGALVGLWGLLMLNSDEGREHFLR